MIIQDRWLFFIRQPADGTLLPCTLFLFTTDCELYAIADLAASSGQSDDEHRLKAACSEMLMILRTNPIEIKR